MKVILLQDVKKQGKKDDILEVSDGYATNFLIKQNLAVPYTEVSKKRLDQEIDLRKKTEAELISELNVIKEKIEKEKLVFNVKTGKEDKVFGSISNKQIKNALEELGYDIKKSEVEIKDSISAIGFYKPKLILHKKVIATLNVEVRKLG